MNEDVIFIFQEAIDLDIKGSKPRSGNMKITKEEKVELAITNGKHCITKELNENDIKMTNDATNKMVGQIDMIQLK